MDIMDDFDQLDASLGETDKSKAKEFIIKKIQRNPSNVQMQ